MPLAPAYPGRVDRLIEVLSIIIFLSLLLLSPYVLAVLKWDYITGGGPAFMRFHPSTYLIILTFLLVLASRGNPINEGLRVVRADIRLGIYLVPWALLSYSVIVVQKQVIGIAIDTFLMPLLIIVICDRLSPAARLSLAYLGHGVMMLNAAVGIGEFLTGWRVAPLIIPGLEINPDFRSSAFFGHPLSNALMMGCYGVMLLSGAGRILPEKLRNFAFVITHIAMVPFGGRTALVLLLVSDFIALGLATFRVLAGGKVRLAYLAGAGLMLPLMPLVVGALVQSGFFDKFIERFTSDAGSARTRIVMFELAQKLTWDDLLFGPPQDYIKFLTMAYGIEYGIESTWVAFVYYFGFLVSILFWVGLVILVFTVMSRCDRKAWFPVAFFFVINSSFLGLAGRTYALTLFVMVLLVMMPRRPLMDLSRQPVPVPPLVGKGAVQC